MRSSFVLVAFLLLTVGGGSLIGLLSLPGSWYEELAKPAFTPPNWIFGPAWTVLYVLIAIAGWRTWRGGRRSVAMHLWFLQLAVNFSWSPVFFRWHRMELALGVIVVLLILILAFVITLWRKDRGAALLFLPYAGWVAFATALNAALVALNRGG